ncbi:MAG: hypothetical protein ACRDND_32910 [Streptosporangiaceae bacterium]
MTEAGWKLIAFMLLVAASGMLSLNQTATALPAGLATMTVSVSREPRLPLSNHRRVTVRPFPYGSAGNA